MLKNLASMSSLNLFKAAMQFGISTLVAVYVLPQEYGLVTFSLPIIQFIALFTDMGLASAIIRQPTLTREEAGAAFTFSLAVALVAGVLLGGLAFPIERSSGLPGLAPVLVALAGAVFFTIVASVPRALMERALRYQRVAALEGISTVVAAVACLGSLTLGAGIWAVVTFHVTLQGMRVVLFLAGARHELALNRHWGRVGALLSFGGWVLATNLINFFGRNAQNILIGAWLGAAAVGLYGLAYQFMILPLMAMAWPASGVLMATLSRLGDGEGADYRRPVLAVSTVTALLAFPVMIYMTFGLAFPIRHLLSPHWATLVPLLATLAPLGALQSLAAYNGAVLIARGHARLQFYVNLVSSVVLLVGFVVALPFGLPAFAATYLIVGSLVALGQIWAKLWGAGVSWGAYGRALVPALGGSVLGLAGAALLGFSPQSWLAWFEVSAVFGIGVLVVLVALRKQVLAAVRDLLGGKQDAAGVADAAADLEATNVPGTGTAPTLA